MNGFENSIVASLSNLFATKPVWEPVDCTNITYN